MNVLTALLLTGVLLYCVWVNLQTVTGGWSNSILDVHPFRQAQTAITAQWLLRGGPWLAYETPVLGAPWSIPLEFPLYQLTVAAAVRVLRIPLDQAGRLMSIVFFYLTLPPAYYLLGRLGVQRFHRFAFLALVLVSPLYIFWSRTFMIESTAVCLGVSYVAATAALLERPRLWLAAVTALAGALAGAVKLTTVVAFGFANAIVVLRGWVRGARSLRQALWVAVAGVCVPVLGTLWWTNFADGRRVANAMARSFLVSRSLTVWMFGSLEMRQDQRFWIGLAEQNVPDIIGHWAIVAAAAVALVLAPRRLLAALVCALLFVSAPLIFANMYAVHNYYACANGLFLIGFVGFGIVSLLERAGWRRLIGIGLLLVAVRTEVLAYRETYEVAQRQDVEIPLADVLERVTDPADVVLIYGHDWNADIAYYAGRRALMDPNDRDLDDPVMAAALSNLDEYHVGAVVMCNTTDQRLRIIEQAQRRFGLRRTAIPGATGCIIFLAEAGDGAMLTAGLDALHNRRDWDEASAHFRRVWERNPALRVCEADDALPANCAACFAAVSESSARCMRERQPQSENSFRAKASSRKEGPE